jgi:hypothetical protein
MNRESPLFRDARDEPNTPSDLVPDWTEMFDRRCEHCGGPLTAERGCRRCAAELKRLSDRYRPVAPGAPDPIVADADDEEPVTQRIP